jgi:1-deoxy-D-xylulose-5-phosphate synthase
VERALTLAKEFGKPVVVHVVTQKGRGYAPAVNDEIEQIHSPGPFRADTGELLARRTGTWTSVFSDEIMQLGSARPDLVAITAAMCEPTGLGPFSRQFPDRFYDVGIAEQHAMTSAAGLASAGMHPVVAIYATFLNRAFDQLLMDVALHRLPVTIVLDRAGLTGSDGPTHNGVWDYAMLGMVPGLAQAAPRDERTLRAELREAVAIETALRWCAFPRPRESRKHSVRPASTRGREK